MSARSKARKRALDVLFEADQRGTPFNQALDQRVRESGRETPLPAYAREIVQGVIDRRREVDAIIADAAPDWTMDRMPAVDRNVLRIATWEILCNDDVASAVAIDEAVTLVSDLSTDDSPRFVNGVLGRIARDAPAIGRDSAADVAADIADLTDDA
ncbi:transcription antitermination factor NusB [Demequina sediminicola]|uniref:transcription antitermination factor NusB n=1 Tax=Demequina sediminicola TaxID=1095026 RepID=UPI0007831AA7|nr:transcription antitermination factor NusB [Demequina sediminicola]